MSDHSADGGAKPTVLRQEGTHRVSVSEGSNVALSASVGLVTPRLRPAVGAAPPVGLDAALQPGVNAAAVRRRGTGSASVTEVRHLPGRLAVTGRTAPTDDPGEQGRERPSASGLEERLALLTRLNRETSQVVTALERAMSEPPAHPAPAGADQRRPFFKRSSP